MGNDTCAAPSCDRRKRLAGLCGMHHQRKLRYGDVLEHIPSRDDRRSDGWLWCSRCEAHKAPDDFHRNRATKTGRDGVCKACVTARRAERSVQLALRRKAWREANIDTVKARKRAYYERKMADDPDWAARRTREIRAANPEKLRQQIKAQNAARYARDKGAPGRASADQIAARWAYYGGKCWMCGAEATDTDHVKPLAAGGCNWPSNLRPACRKCNRSKSGAWPYPLEVARVREAAHRQGPASRSA